jgi:hypothetical protein
MAPLNKNSTPRVANRSPAFGYPAKDHVLAWRPEMRI